MEPRVFSVNENANDWVARDESEELGLSVENIDNLLNEAIDDMRHDRLMPSALERYLVPDSGSQNVVASNPFDDNFWSNSDFRPIGNNSENSLPIFDSLNLLLSEKEGQNEHNEPNEH